MTTTRHPITGPSAWRGQDLAGAEDWITALPAGAADEIHTALQGVAGRPWRDITRDDFRLPDFTKTLAELAHELEHGRGFVRLRGLPVERYDEDDLRKLLWGIGAHLGTPIHHVEEDLRVEGEPGVMVLSNADGRPDTNGYPNPNATPWCCFA